MREQQKQLSPHAVAIEYINMLSELEDASVVRECRMGVGYLFFEVGKYFKSLEDFDRAHNYFQLAMAMFWDVSRTHLECFNNGKIFYTDWINNFMNEYLGLASIVRRHEDDGLQGMVKISRDSAPLRIAIATVCAYPQGHKLSGIEKISLKNRHQYAKRYGYNIHFQTDVHGDAGFDRFGKPRHPVWTAIGLPLRLLETGNYDYVMWMDCDALFMNKSVRIEDLIERYSPGRDLYISEDGRGLSGGNWIVKNSDFGKKLLKNIFENFDFDNWDLRDQFGFLWTLVRPGLILGSFDLISKNHGYPHQVGLLPQRLINAYPWSLCRPSHHCFEEGDFIVSFITLGSQSRTMAFSLLENFSSRIN